MLGPRDRRRVERWDAWLGLAAVGLAIASTATGMLAGGGAARADLIGVVLVLIALGLWLASAKTKEASAPAEQDWSAPQDA